MIDLLHKIKQNEIVEQNISDTLDRVTKPDPTK